MVLVHAGVGRDPLDIQHFGQGMMGSLYQAGPEIVAVVKDIVNGGRRREPTARLQFSLKLSGAPTGMANEYLVGQIRAEYQAIKMVFPGGEEHAVKDLQFTQVGYGVDGHDGPRNRTAQVDRAATVAPFVAHVGPQLPQSLVRGPVEDQPQGPLFVMLDHQHHGPNEIRIE